MIHTHSLGRARRYYPERTAFASKEERLVPTWSHLLCASDALCRNHASTLATTPGSFVELARQAIDTSIEVSDFTSADMFTEIAQGIDKWH